MDPASVPGASRVVLVCDRSGPDTGIGRYWRMLHPVLRQAGLDAVQMTPMLPQLPDASYHLLRLLRRDLRAFLTNYPMWCSYPDAELYHFTSQPLAALLLLSRPKGRVVVTVHDIFPFMLRHNPQLRSPYQMDRLYVHAGMAGLKRADHLIADSDYTKRCLVEHLGIEPRRITVVHPGIDHERFRPSTVPESIRETYRLTQGRRYLIYVGSENPRKDLVTLIRALATVRAELPNVELLKVGRSDFEKERQRLRKLATRLGVDSAIHFLEDVPENDLPLLYNAADVHVMPSLYEGFGFPVLEAMACGTPVVYANVGSLPEIAGTAGIAVAPSAADALARAVLSLLKVQAERARLGAAGRERAARFTWAGTALSTVAVYNKLLQSGAELAGLAEEVAAVEGPHTS